MIKAIIFDLDGVLVDTKDIHFTALNNAIEKVPYNNWWFLYQVGMKSFNAGT